MNLLLACIFLIIPLFHILKQKKLKKYQMLIMHLIMYHRFGDSRYPSTNITKKQFAEHINELLKPKYNVINIEEALLAMFNKTSKINQLS